VKWPENAEVTLQIPTNKQTNKQTGKARLRHTLREGSSRGQSTTIKEEDEERWDLGK
jgi:hypothetical protein